ncbi:MAG: helix-turn-helix domain-containing protein [Spirochaetaceae bacterium]|jgi:transcriptional regulator with XRE-family HTH domain|nr:helix-turn-helix domain-containing protein [Spirochaetaceae bacterium]
MRIQELFIANLKDYRKQRKISQLQLASLCDSSQTYIAEIEVGKKFPSLDMIEKIAAALNIESYHLFQNIASAADTGERVLTPVQKQEIAEKVRAAVMKIVAKY